MNLTEAVMHDQRMRLEAIEMALRTPNDQNCHERVLIAAAAYFNFIQGKAADTAAA